LARAGVAGTVLAPRFRRWAVAGLVTLALALGLSVGPSDAEAFGVTAPDHAVSDLLPALDSVTSDPVKHGIGAGCLLISCILLVLALRATVSRRDLRPMVLRPRPDQTHRWHTHLVAAVATTINAPRRC